MSSVGGVDGSNSVLNNLAIDNKKVEEDSGDELGQDVFLELMIAQLENQDPLSPQDNGEFVAQLAQFSSVEGIDNLNTTMDSMAASYQSSQALQASAMVGRTVLVPNESAQLDAGETVSGSMHLPVSSGDVTVNVYNEAGILVDVMDLESQVAGDIAFEWDGLDADGNAFTPGRYRFEANAVVEGTAEALETYLPANVNSVTIGSGGNLTLNVEGAGAVSLSDVKEIS